MCVFQRFLQDENLRGHWRQRALSHTVLFPTSHMAPLPSQKPSPTFSRVSFFS